LSQKEKDLGVQQKYVDQEKGKLDKMLAENNVAMDLQLRMDIMEEVRKHFEQKLLIETNAYSKDLQKAIQVLLDRMLSGTRRVTMSPKFELSVKDNFGKEDKSEGQFAISSFAYIGGICKLLSEIPSLSDKEFPLVLDGPFSKLDAQHRQNVVDTIPTYAPQVILFSKDDINDCFGESGPDHVWTIYSNEDRHISKVEPGYDPEVFLVNADHS
jgi:wobble nucleotide-excising tRNase